MAGKKSPKSETVYNCGLSVIRGDIFKTKNIVETLTLA